MKPYEKNLSLLVIGFLATCCVLFLIHRNKNSFEEKEQLGALIHQQEKMIQQFTQLEKQQEQYLHERQRMAQRISQLETILSKNVNNNDPTGTEIAPGNNLTENTNGTVPYRQHLEDYFWNEEREGKWSGHAEDLLLSKFQEHPLLNNTTYEVNCKSSLCRLETTEGLETGENMPQLLDLLSDLDWQTQIHFEKIQQENGETGTVIYLARVGHSLPEFM